MSLLLVMQVNGNVLSSGTGFLCHHPSGAILITNRHNFTGRHQETGQPLSPTGGLPNQVVIWHNAIEGLGTWRAQTELLIDDEGNPLWIEHPTLGAKADFVALRLTQTTDIALYPYDLNQPGPSIRAGPSDYLSVIGFPFGMSAGGRFPVWATGFMASEPDIDFNDLPIVLIDCRTRQGQSGSAVIAYRSAGMVPMEDGSAAMFGGSVFRLLGIYSGRVNPESDLGIVWKVRAIADLIDSLQ
jgi:hypothetical protein